MEIYVRAKFWKVQVYSRERYRVFANQLVRDSKKTKLTIRSKSHTCGYFVRFSRSLFLPCDKPQSVRSNSAVRCSQRYLFICAFCWGTCAWLWLCFVIAVRVALFEDWVHESVSGMFHRIAAQSTSLSPFSGPCAHVTDRRIILLLFWRACVAITNSMVRFPVAIRRCCASRSLENHFLRNFVVFESELSSKVKTPVRIKSSRRDKTTRNV